VSERCQYCDPLWRGQLLGLVQDRADQLVQPGEGDLPLGLDPSRREYTYPVGCREPGHLRQQRRLADPGLAAHDHRTAAVAHAADAVAEQPQLSPAANQ
jgi:hypothetical protein